MRLDGRGDGGAVRKPVVVRRRAARVEASDGRDAIEAGDERLELGAYVVYTPTSGREHGLVQRVKEHRVKTTDGSTMNTVE